MTPEKASVAWNIAAGLGVLLLLSSVIPSKTCPSPSPRMRAVNHMKSLALACRAYAADWEGKLPPTLDALYPDYIDVESYFFAIDPNGGKIPIIYRGGENLAEEDQISALLEWPIPFGDKKIVSYTNGHVTEERLKQ